MTRNLLLLLLAGTLALPMVAAQSEPPETLALEVDADEVVLRMIEPVTGEDAAELRAEIDDEYGNGDGFVQASEMKAANDETVMTFDRDDPDCFEDFDLARIGGKVPKRISEFSHSVTGAQGRVDSTATIFEHNVIRFLYPSSGNSPKVEFQFMSMDAMGEAIGCYMGSNWDFGAYPPSGWSGSGPPYGPGGGFGDAFAQEQQPTESTGDGDTILLLYPTSQGKIDKASIRPESLQSLWDGKGLRADTDAERARFSTNEISFTVQGGGSAAATFAGTAKDVGAIVGFSVLGVGAVAGVLALTTEYFRYKFLKWLLIVPLFSRLEKNEVLEHGKRDELYRFIKSNPGPSFSDLRRELDLSNGTLVHHLRILESQEYVKPVRDGFRTRFYIRGPKIVPTSYLTRTQQQLLEAIGANPGLTQKELSLVLGLPRESVSYHTKQLASKGKLQIKQDGKWRRYWVPAPTPATGTANPAGA